MGALTLDVLLGDVRSLKQKRSVFGPIVAELPAQYRRRGGGDRQPRPVPAGEIGVAVVASTAAHCTALLDSCERLVAGRPEIELLSARQRLFNDEE